MTDGTFNSGAAGVSNTANSNTPAWRRRGAYREAASRKTWTLQTVLGTLLAVGVLLLLVMAPADAADAPSDLTATAGDTQVTLEWDDPNDSTITGYRVLWMEPTARLDDPSKTGSDSVSIEAGDKFGQSVGIDGGRAVVGAPFQESLNNANQEVENGGWGHAFSRNSSTRVELRRVPGAK